MTDNLKLLAIGLVFSCFLPFSPLAEASPGTTVISRGVESAYGEVPEVDGITDTALQTKINENISVAINELTASLRGKKDLNYSYQVLANRPIFLSIMLKADTNGAFAGARGINVDVKTGESYHLNDFFKATPDFFEQLEKNLGWRPTEKTPFALSEQGIRFIREADGEEQQVGYENIFNWLDLGKSGYYINYHPITAEANGKLLRVKTGELAVLMLDSNRTTGYAWQLKGEANNPVLQFVGTSYIINSTRIGSGGVEVFTFGVLKPGETTIEMEYKRPWEKQAIKTVKIQLVAE